MISDSEVRMLSDDVKLREAKISLGAKPVQTTLMYNNKINYG